MISPNVSGILLAPNRETSLFAISRAMLKIRETGTTFKDIAKVLECSADTISTAVTESHSLTFHDVARLCYFWPDETHFIKELWTRADSDLGPEDHAAAIARHTAALAKLAGAA